MNIEEAKSKTNARHAAEEQLIGALFVGDCRKWELMPAPEEFKDPIFRRFWAAAFELCSKGVVPDVMMALAHAGFTDEERKKTTPLVPIIHAMNQVCTDHNLEFWKGKLFDIAREEQLVQIRNQSSKRLQSGDDPTSVLAWANEQEQSTLSRYTDTCTGIDMQQPCYDLVNSAIDGKRPEGLLYTGLRPFDYLSGGLVPGEYVVLAARPSCGKTSVALNIMVSLARRGITSVFFSLEMSRQLVASTISAIVTQVSGRKMLREPHKITEYERQTILASGEELMQVSKLIRVYAKPGMKAAEMARIMRQEVRAGAKIGFIDHVLLTNEAGENETQRIGRFSKCWNQMIKENGIPGVLLAQLSRENVRDNREPKLSDLKQSGSLEEDADIVWFLHPPKGVMTQPRERMKGIQAKGRTCGVGFSEFWFYGPTQTCSDIEENEAPEEPPEPQEKQEALF